MKPKLDQTSRTAINQSTAMIPEQNGITALGRNCHPDLILQDSLWLNTHNAGSPLLDLQPSRLLRVEHCRRE